MKAINKYLKSAVNKINRYTRFKFSLPLLTFLGMIAGLVFVINLSDSLLNTRVKATDIVIKRVYQCEITQLYKDSDINCSGEIIDQGMGMTETVYPAELSIDTCIKHNGKRSIFSQCRLVGCRIPPGYNIVDCNANTITPASGPSPTPPLNPTNTSTPPNISPSPTPTGSTGGGCGVSCDSTHPCQSGFECKDVGTGGNVCWKESQCGGPALKSRIEGVVRGCNNEPLQDVPVFAWGNTDLTDQNGVFRLDKGLIRDSEGDIQTRSTSVLAGNDATKNPSTGKGFFNNGIDRQYDALKLRSMPAGQVNSCDKVNCLFAEKNIYQLGEVVNGEEVVIDPQKLMKGGDPRTAYKISSGMEDSFFEYNFVFTNAYAGKFNFKKIDCPSTPTATPTPTLSCNASCSTNTQCSATNPNWYCAAQYTYSGWSDQSSSINPINVFSGNTTVSVSANTTSFNAITNPTNGSKTQHLVKGGLLYSRNKNAQGVWDSAWTKIDTSSTSAIMQALGTQATGALTSFSSFYNPSGVIVQNIVKGGKLYGRTGTSGSFANNTSSVNPSGNTGSITAFSAYTHRDNYIVQRVVKGGKSYIRNNLTGSFNSWQPETSFDNCTSCGTGTLLSVEVDRHENGAVKAHIVREGNKMYSLNYNLASEKCRSKSNPTSASCN